MDEWNIFLLITLIIIVFFFFICICFLVFNLFLEQSLFLLAWFFSVHILFKNFEILFFDSLCNSFHINFKTFFKGNTFLRMRQFVDDSCHRLNIKKTRKFFESVYDVLDYIFSFFWSHIFHIHWAMQINSWCSGVCTHNRCVFFAVSSISFHSALLLPFDFFWLEPFSSENRKFRLF